MKKLCALMNDSFPKSAARFMEYVCYVVILFFMSGLVLSVLGRQTFILHTRTGTYDSAIYAEESHHWTSRGPTSSLNDAVRVTVDNGEKIDLITQAGLSAMYAVNIIPLIIGYWFLSRVFHNVSKGRIFTERNASCLLYYGLIQMAVALFVPFAKVFIGYLTGQFTTNRIAVSIGQSPLNGAIPHIAFIIAAYIIRYGIHLQDEADHTL